MFVAAGFRPEDRRRAVGAPTQPDGVLHSHPPEERLQSMAQPRARRRRRERRLNTNNIRGWQPG